MYPSSSIPKSKLCALTTLSVCQKQGILHKNIQLAGTCSQIKGEYIDVSKHVQYFEH